MTIYYIETAEGSPGVPTIQPPAGGKFVLDATGSDQLESMPGCHGMLGWKEFLQNRDDMLRVLDRAVVINGSRPTNTDHGPAFEASLRKWLEEFLPRRYAVTSGFIIPNIREVGEKLYHYDVVIYDAMESPVLWANSNEDHSNQGRQRAIPAKYVLAVYEVKATLTTTSARLAMTKLRELAALEKHLPGRFSSGVVFGQVRDRTDSGTLKAILAGSKLRGFWGGVVLRAECDPSMTGVLIKGPAAEGQKDGLSSKRIAVPISRLNIRRGADGSIVNGRGAGIKLRRITTNTYAATKRYPVHYCSGGEELSLMWSHSGFAEFAGQLLNALEGIPFFSEESSAAMFAEVFDRID